MNVSKSIILGLAIMVCFAITAVFANPAHTGTLIIQKLPADDQDSSSGNVHGFTGLPLTDDGWTDFRFMIREQNLYQDARVVFVSNSEGNDGTGNVYSITDITFDSNGMFQPAGPVNAFKSIDVAYNNIRKGYPDILLLKRGDEWSTGLGGYAKSGRNLTERHIIASYGTGDRPQLFSTMLNARDASFLIVSGLRFYTTNWRTSGRALDITGSVNHQLYEDIWFDQHNEDKIQGGTSGIFNVAIRRCIYTNYQAHDGFMYVARITGLLLEENSYYKPFQKNYPDENRYGRFLYLSPSGFGDDKNALVNINLRRNIFYAGEREALDPRGGGVLENNLIVASDLTTVGGRGGSTDSIQSTRVVNNVFMEGTPNIKGTNRLVLINIDGGLIYGNIWTDNLNLGSSVNTITITGSDTVNVSRNIEISSNVIHGFSGHGSTRAFSVASTLTEVNNVTIENNEFQYIYGSSEIMLHRAWQEDRFAGFTYRGNKYYSAIAATGWFTPGGTLAGWVEGSGETGAQSVQISYPDPNRNLRTYNETLGGSADTDLFMSKVILQSRHNWNPEYTACETNNYIRAGFGKAPVECTYQ